MEHGAEQKKKGWQAVLATGREATEIGKSFTFSYKSKLSFQTITQSWEATKMISATTADDFNKCTIYPHALVILSYK